MGFDGIKGVSPIQHGRAGIGLRWPLSVTVPNCSARARTCPAS
jgi:hypothetical protein